MQSDTEILAKLRFYSDNPTERQLKHLQIRDIHTTSLTDNAPDTTTWAAARIIATLKASKTFDGRLLDVGCGTGNYLSYFANTLTSSTVGDMSDWLKLAVGLDRSGEALAETRKKLAEYANFSLLQSDALNLPFADPSFGAAMANRMLNQTGDIAHALSEIRRVLVPGGLLFVVTADSQTVPILRAIHDTALEKLGLPAHLYRHSTDPHQRLNRENGLEWFKAAGFSQVDWEEYLRVIVFRDVETALEHYTTGLTFQKSNGFAEPGISLEKWLDLYNEVKNRVAEVFEQQGHLEIHEGAGMFTVS